MPTKQTDETKSEHKTASESRLRSPFKLIFGALLVLFGLLAVVNGLSSVTDNKSRLLAPNGIIVIETVDTPESRQQGLSGRSSIDDGAGMMFEFVDTVPTNCFWMKDMQFSIDMVWLDENKKVVTIEADVPPDSYPDSYCPDEPAKYGLELGSGRASALGIEKDTILKF